MKSFKTPKGTELPIMDMRGKDYLEVKYRLVWFREERPGWTIETDFLSLDDKSAFAKAIIKDESGRVLATGHKFEDKQGFADFREKSETGAIGRALVLIGYGTQFVGDELDEGVRVVDSPVAPKSTPMGTVHAVPQGGDGLAPECCQGRMMVSKYNPNEFYCSKCKRKAPRAA